MLNYNAKDNHLAADPRGSSPTWCVHECTFPHSHSLYSRERTKTASTIYLTVCERYVLAPESRRRVTLSLERAVRWWRWSMVVGDAHFWQRTSRIYTGRRILFLHSRIILNKRVSILQDIRLDLSLRG